MIDVTEFFAGEIDIVDVVMRTQKKREAVVNCIATLTKKQQEGLRLLQYAHSAIERAMLTQPERIEEVLEEAFITAVALLSVGILKLSDSAVPSGS